MIAKKYLIENYDCSEYLSAFEDSYLLNLLQILPYKDIVTHPITQHLTIGYIGKDKLEVCYQFQKSGIWAFYPTTQEYEKLSSSIQELIDTWQMGKIVLQSKKISNE